MSRPKIFVSYSMKDAAWAQQFVDALSSYDVDVWLDINRVPAGQPVQEQMERAFRESDYLATLVIPDSVHTPNLLFEIGAAVGMGKTIVPVIPKDMDLSQLPPPLRARQFVVRSTPKETARQFVSQLKLKAA